LGGRGEVALFEAQLLEPLLDYQANVHAVSSRLTVLVNP
jgi:hypothetical protein